jgi:hypothetical protein
MNRERAMSDELLSPAAEGGSPVPVGRQAGGAGEKPIPSWAGPVLVFVLITCCLLPLFLVVLGDWLAAQGWAWPAARWLVLIGVARGLAPGRSWRG